MDGAPTGTDVLEWERAATIRHWTSPPAQRRYRTAWRFTLLAGFVEAGWGTVAALH